MDPPNKVKIKITEQKPIEDKLSKYTKLNIRVNGITLDFAFLAKLNDPDQQLTSAHIIFYQNLFKKYFSNQEKVFAVDVYFFTEYIPTLNKGLSDKLINTGINNFPKQEVNNIQQQQNNMQNQFQAIKIEEIKEKPVVIQKNPELQKFKFEIKRIEVVKQEEGELKINKMQQNLQKYNQENNLDLEQNPVYQHRFSFFPVNIQNIHWISLIVDPENETILYQDSVFERINDKIKKGILQLLDYKKPKKYEWKLLTRSPQQKQSQDCGVFILYSLFFLYKNKKLIEIQDLNQQRARQIRYNLIDLAIAEFEKELTAEDVIQIVEKK